MWVFKRRHASTSANKKDAEGVDTTGVKDVLHFCIDLFLEI